MPRGSKRSKKAGAPRGLSLRALGRQLGVSLAAVQKAIANGRLKESVGRDNRRRPFITDAKLAAREWKDGAGRVANSGKANPAGEQPPDPAAGAADPGAAAPPPGATSLVDAQVRVGIERARSLEISNRIKLGELLDAGEVAREQFEAARVVRDQILSIPDRISAELASETDPRLVHKRLSDELKKALSTLADELERE